jgi:hypothetical protein
MEFVINRSGSSLTHDFIPKSAETGWKTAPTLLRWEGFGNFSRFGQNLENLRIATDWIFVRNFGAGDRDRTGDVQLGNFLLKRTFSTFAATTYLIFCADETLFLT